MVFSFFLFGRSLSNALSLYSSHYELEPHSLFISFLSSFLLLMHYILFYCCCCIRSNSYCTFVDNKISTIKSLRTPSRRMKVTMFTVTHRWVEIVSVQWMQKWNLFIFAGFVSSSLFAQIKRCIFHPYHIERHSFELFCLGAAEIAHVIYALFSFTIASIGCVVWERSPMEFQLVCILSTASTTLKHFKLLKSTDSYSIKQIDLNKFSFFLLQFHSWSSILLQILFYFLCRKYISLYCF